MRLNYFDSCARRLERIMPNEAEREIGVIEQMLNEATWTDFGLRASLNQARERIKLQDAEIARLQRINSRLFLVLVFAIGVPLVVAAAHYLGGRP